MERIENAKSPAKVGIDFLLLNVPFLIYKFQKFLYLIRATKTFSFVALFVRRRVILELQS